MAPECAVGGEGQPDTSLPVAAADVDLQITVGKGQWDPSLPVTAAAAAAAGGQSTAVEGGGERQQNTSLSLPVTAVVDGPTDFPVIVGDHRDLEAGGCSVGLVGETCVAFGSGIANPDPPREFKLYDWEPKPHDFIVLFVVSEVLGMMFEVIYEDSHIVPYFIMWMGCVMFAICSANRLAKIEGGMAYKEQFAVYLRGFSFFLLQVLHYWGVHQGVSVTCLKVVLKVSGAILGWWVVGVLRKYKEAFRDAFSACFCPQHQPLHEC